MAKKFYVEGLTVNEIFNLSFQELNKLNEREMSRALRTVALAVNKRIAKLEKYADKTGEDGRYAPAGKKSIAVDALNWITNDGKLNKKFGVKKTADRNEMYKELGRARQFWNMQSSTVTGAVKLRRTREERIFGKTREQMARGKSQTERQSIYRTIDENTRAMWKSYRRTLELMGRDSHAYIDDSDKIQSFIGKEVVNEEELSFFNADGEFNEMAIDEIAMRGKSEADKLYAANKDKAAEDLEKRPGRFRQ